mmetsp:Transcript_149940/g.259725  ORF Transcript_149940/g.259725 Transcript_149940/m.259725 type:complete len:186 (+) Transcript_149940:2-559(+)
MVTWAALTVSTGSTKNLDEAVDWHIALIWLKGVAQARLQRLATANAEDPLTNDELLQVLELAPSMQLSFITCVREKSSWVYTPTTQDLVLAMEFRRLGQQGSLHHFKLHKREMARQVLQQKKHLQVREGMLAKAVVGVRASRSGLLVALKQSSSSPSGAHGGLRARIKSMKAKEGRPLPLAKGGG